MKRLPKKDPISLRELPGCHSRENGNPEKAAKELDSRFRGNDDRIHPPAVSLVPHSKGLESAVFFFRLFRREAKILTN